MARKLAAVPVKSAGDLLVDTLLADIDEADLEVDSRGRELLETIRQLRDRMESLQQVIAEDGERSVSASGIVRLHPGIAEYRAHARTLALLVARVNVDSPNKDADKVKAAESRWAVHNAGKRGA
ncbi:hypothetical protein [Nocardia sp. alder85J]|uniref:hypothetical protein n=1 Tax=Nocardia sp. alder85J TaxID=2862949 RepID=UPI001CD21DF9|nr:hypothetical protein [Nocardia sp. alder85J]MCX4095335.1 hypothetical protein [Nocardia sp. alder85J]